MLLKSVWTLGLAAIGFLTFLLHGIDKVTVSVGSFFIVASCLSVLRQAGRMSIDHEMPILVIMAGLLLMMARMPGIPVPAWAMPTNPQKQ